MNERIKELWENCDDIQVVYPRQGSPIYASPELLEKFAELIVKECAEVLDTWNKENGAEEGLDKAGLISLWSPHFGVKD